MLPCTTCLRFTPSSRSVKVALLSHTPKQIQVNLETALPVIVGHIKGGWDNIQSLHIKTSTSISLPVWTCDLGSEEGGRWIGLVAEAEEEAASETSEEEEEEEAEEKEEEEEEEEEEEPVKPKKAVGSKRVLEEKTAQPLAKKRARR
jgi:ribosome biogenesis protein UTP30